MSKPPIEYRQPRPASSSGRTADFGSAKPGSNPGAGATKPDPKVLASMRQPNGDILLAPEATKEQHAAFRQHLTVLQQLEHKKAVKAAQMRRYRAKKAGKK